MYTYMNIYVYSSTYTVHVFMLHVFCFSTLINSVKHEFSCSALKLDEYPETI